MEDGSYFNWYASDGSANTMASINPLSQIYDPYNVNDTWRSMGNMQLDYKIHGFEDLRLNLNLGYDFSRTTGTTYNELGSILSKELVQPTIIKSMPIRTPIHFWNFTVIIIRSLVFTTWM